ncbi:SDR family NAD(P)-dependent oxidoreductase [Asanoa iriomotensis]|uniref:Short-chain dehydrogenase n=1 Tax=Asanoa iriomotensis TaxID=234613 RepID=A0ABQ4C106_9ACTN|nr:short-chain dehydrogenase [Asanoa iriomotensis]
MVTGANRGLGLAVAARLVAAGHRVVVTARNGDDARRVTAELGPPAEPAELDVLSAESVDAARDQVGPVDILVSNAGALCDAGMQPSTVSLDLVQRHLAVNTLGAWRVIQAFLPGMTARGWGRVVIVSSGTSTFTNGIFPGTPCYSVSKVALNALTVMLAEETRGTGVLVNAVNPGRVRTRMMPRAEVTPEEAALDVAWVAEMDDGAPTGKLFRSRQVVGW